FQQLEQRERAAPVIHGHHDLVDVVPLADLLDVAVGRDELPGRDDTIFSIGLDIADHDETPSIGSTAQICDGSCALAAPVDQHTALECFVIYDMREYVARCEQPQQ